MKISLSCLTLFLSVFTEAQERTIHLTDSLIKPLHVKSRVQYIGSWGASETTFYNVNGDIKQVISSVETGIPMIKTTFIYDSLGKLRSSKRKVCKEYITSCVLLDPLRRCAQSLITNYDYDARQRLKCIHTQDSLGQILSESFYRYDSSQIITKIYYADHTITESIEDFEKPNVIRAFTCRNYDSLGNVFPANSSTTKNKFNSKNQLVKSTFRGMGPTCRKFYEYYPNGLIKRKFGDDCLFNWTVYYTFY